MDRNIKDTARNDARRDNPAYNQSGDAHDPASPAVRAEELAQEPGQGMTPTPGMAYNGDFRVGRVTISAGGDQGLRLRLENDGTVKNVAEGVLEGLLIDNFFNEKFESREDLHGSNITEAERRDVDNA